LFARLSPGSADFRRILGEFPAVLEVSRRILLSVPRTAWFAPDSSSRPPRCARDFSGSRRILNFSGHFRGSALESGHFHASFYSAADARQGAGVK
jgi:hypothetical protein